MAPMLRTLYQHPEKGFLGGQSMVYWRGVALVQYWRSFEDLEQFARNPSDPHLSAWQRFNKSVGSDGSVGIWHETYKVNTGGHEAIYSNMPRFGLAAAAKHDLPVNLMARGRLPQVGELAKRGWVGVADALTAPYGFYAQYTAGVAKPDVELDDLWSLCSEHQADIQEAVKRVPFGRHSGTSCQSSCLPSGVMSRNDHAGPISSMPRPLRK